VYLSPLFSAVATFRFSTSWLERVPGFCFLFSLGSVLWALLHSGNYQLQLRPTIRNRKRSELYYKEIKPDTEA
jgi:hypothetical protein